MCKPVANLGNPFPTSNRPLTVTSRFAAVARIAESRVANKTCRLNTGFTLCTAQVFEDGFWPRGRNRIEETRCEILADAASRRGSIRQTSVARSLDDEVAGRRRR